MTLAARITDRSAKLALCRVLEERARMGCAELSTRGMNADLLTLRKRIKELRALLRLIRSGLADARTLDQQLRDAAQGLSQTRDLEVMLDCLDGLTAGLRRPAQFAGLRGLILNARAARPASDLIRAQAVYSETLDRVQHRLHGLSLSDKASSLIWQNAGATYHRAHQTHARARHAFRAGSDADPFHEWRKWVKRHWYQARFLKPMKPDRMRKHIARIDRLGKTLGAHNDLDVLMGFLDATETLPAADIAARDILRGHVLSHRRGLACQSLQQARSALSLPADALITEWQGWWRIWRKSRHLTPSRD